MLVRKHRRTDHRAWHWLAAVAAVTVLLAAWAAPMSAAPNKTTLSGASVSPRSGTTNTTITVAVVYRNQRGSRADNVTVHVGKDDHAMQQVPGGDWRHGITFRWSGTAKEGTQAVVFTARGRDHSEATLAAGTVKISAPKAAEPSPTPTPRPTRKPTPKPTARPTVKPAARATPRPTRKPITVAKPTAIVEPDPTPVGQAAAPSGAPWPEPSSPPLTAAVIGGFGGLGPGGPGSAAGPDPGGPGGGGTGGSDVPTDPRGGGGRGDGKASGPLAALLAMVGLDGPTFPTLGLAPTIVTTTGAVATAMAFGLFGRRRRDDEQLSDDVLAAAAASGVGVDLTRLAGGAVPLSDIGGDRDRQTADGPPPEAVGPHDDELLMPRWRRPSLIQARKADPIRDTTPAPRLTFGRGFVGPLAGPERRVIRYRVVRLLDTPDELRGAEIGYLDQGDEVQLLEKYGAYWLVASPDGQQGWLHKMVLGEAVEADGGPSADVPIATMPTVADSWTMGESDIDSDVLDAYLAARRREAS